MKNPIPPDLPDKITVENTPFSVEDTGISSEGKLDQLIATALEVKHALVIRDTLLGLGAAVVAAVIVWGGINTHETQTIAKRADTTAQRAYRQSLVNNRDVLQYRRDFAMTRDCPIIYLKDLLAAASAHANINDVQPPCQPEDIAAIDAKIADVDARIKAAGG